MSLFEAALAARANAHAPYSNFAVGAALRSESGAVYAGCNVENIAYPEGTCAEAGAIAAMVAAGDRHIAEIWVVADAPQPVSPCGGCRQKIAEFGGPETVIVLAGPGGERARTTLAALLPGGFDASQMP